MPIMEKRSRTTNKVEREDRLSSLPDAILIVILSLLPLDLAILSGSLSRRWRNLWTNITSVQLTSKKFNDNEEFVTTINSIVMQITSPIIHTFILEFERKEEGHRLRYAPNSCLQAICDKNVRELKVSSALDLDFLIPGSIFQTQSLESVELQSVFCSEFPDSVDLPNVKRLVITRPPLWNWECFDKLMTGCPLLEEVSLQWVNCEKDIRLSHHNLKQLSIYCGYIHKCKTIVISAPKLVCLDIRYFRSVIVSFDEEPILLREIKSEMSSNHEYVVSQKENNLMSQFHSVRQLTFVVRVSSNIENMLTLVRLCPALDILILEFENGGCKELNFAMLPDVSVLQQVKKIEIKTFYQTYLKCRKSIWELVQTLLNKLMCMEEFHFQMSNKYFENVNVQEEVTLCKLLYSCPIASTSCDVRFTGGILEMSRKAGPYAKKANGEVITFDGTPTS